MRGGRGSKKPKILRTSYREALLWIIFPVQILFVHAVCGGAALCRSALNRPVCYCPDGFEGNPYNECKKVGNGVCKAPILSYINVKPTTFVRISKKLFIHEDTS